MATVYVRDLPQNAPGKTHKFTQYDRCMAGLCMNCGERERCFCRYCDSCSELWVGAVSECGDEDGHPREICPDCRDGAP
jgi:hypothetical protein